MFSLFEFLTVLCSQLRLLRPDHRLPRGRVQLWEAAGRRAGLDGGGGGRGAAGDGHRYGGGLERNMAQRPPSD